MASWRPKQPSVMSSISVDVLRCNKPERGGDVRFSTHSKVTFLKQVLLLRCLTSALIPLLVCLQTQTEKESSWEGLQRGTSSGMRSQVNIWTPATSLTPTLCLPSVKREPAIGQADKSRAEGKKEPREFHHDVEAEKKCTGNSERRACHGHMMGKRRAKRAKTQHNCVSRMVRLWMRVGCAKKRNPLPVQLVAKTKNNSSTRRCSLHGWVHGAPYRLPLQLHAEVVSFGDY